MVHLSQLISSKDCAEPEKNNTSVDLIQNKLGLRLPSEELLWKGLSVCHSLLYLQNSWACHWPGLYVLAGIWTTCGPLCPRTALEDTPRLWPVTEPSRTLSVGSSCCRPGPRRALHCTHDWSVRITHWRDKRCSEQGFNSVFWVNVEVSLFISK